MKKYLLLFISLLLVPFAVLANDQVNVYVFHSESCPHCKQAISYLNELQESDKQINVLTYEISQEVNAYNRNLLSQVEEVLDVTVQYVPFVVIGNNYSTGFSELTKEEYKEYINFYETNNYSDKVGIKLGLVKDNGYEPIEYSEKDYKVTIPLIGNINLKKLSLPVVAIVIGLVDGFNPCAMWILLFLITMLFGMKNRKKMWILGLTFIGTSAFIYFLFMMAWLKVSSFINSITILKILVGIFAICFGAVNLYRYFKEKKTDGCTIVNKEKRKLVISSIKKIVQNKSFVLSIIGIIVLAILVNLIELLCSMGLPVMFTEILSLNNLSKNVYLGYITIYIIFFMLDDIIIFVISMLSLKSTAISTKYNKYSHLIGGIIMILIGLLLIFKPEWLAFSF